MNIIFFDETCPLCQKSVRFILNIDKRHLFFFAPLSGKTAQEKLSPSLQQANSLVLLADRTISIRSRAIFKILWMIGGLWKPLGLLSFFPFGLDVIYRLIAKHRHFLLKKGNIALSNEEQLRFLP